MRSTLRLFLFGISTYYSFSQIPFVPTLILALTFTLCAFVLSALNVYRKNYEATTFG
jgi:hypothetical protein